MRHVDKRSFGILLGNSATISLIYTNFRISCLSKRRYPFAVVRRLGRLGRPTDLHRCLSKLQDHEFWRSFVPPVMEAVGAVGSIAGIASFGLQLAQLLQKQISEIRDAEERVNDLVSEVRATSNNLDQIKSLLLSNDASTKTPTLNHRFREDLQFLIQRCETIFRNVVTLLAKAGAGALSSVDGFLRPFRRNEKSKPDVDIKLKMEFVQLSASNKALWSFKRPKIEECIADLGRLKSELMLLLLIISLLKTAPISTEYNIQILSGL